jgi:hypothetical protein
MTKWLCGFICFFCLSARADTDFKNIYQWELGFGPALVDAINTPYVLASWRFGYDVQLDPKMAWFLEADWVSPTGNTDAYFFTLAFGGSYFFSNEEQTPFVTADIGYGSVHSHRDCESYICEPAGDDAAGVAIGMGAGYKFLRNSMFNLGVLARYDLLVGTTTRGTPAKYTIQGIVYY